MLISDNECVPQTTQDLNLKKFCGTKWGWRSVGKCFKTLHPTCNQFLSHHCAPVYFKARPVALTARGEEKWHDLDRWALPDQDSVNVNIFSGSYMKFIVFSTQICFNQASFPERKRRNSHNQERCDIESYNPDSG